MRRLSARGFAPFTSMGNRGKSCGVTLQLDRRTARPHPKSIPKNSPFHFPTPPTRQPSSRSPHSARIPGEGPVHSGVDTVPAIKERATRSSGRCGDDVWQMSRCADHHANHLETVERLTPIRLAISARLIPAASIRAASMRLQAPPCASQYSRGAKRTRSSRTASESGPSQLPMVGELTPSRRAIARREIPSASSFSASSRRGSALRASAKRCAWEMRRLMTTSGGCVPSQLATVPGVTPNCRAMATRLLPAASSCAAFSRRTSALREAVRCWVAITGSSLPSHRVRRDERTPRRSAISLRLIPSASSVAASRRRSAFN